MNASKCTYFLLICQGSRVLFLSHFSLIFFLKDLLKIKLLKLFFYFHFRPDRREQGDRRTDWSGGNTSCQN